MTTQSPTFMLLPDWTYKPGDIPLGALLLLSDETKLPDPDNIVNEGTRVDPESVSSAVESPFSFAFEKGRTLSTSFDAEVPLFSPVSGGIKYGRTKNDKFALNCASLETKRFTPSSSYMSRSVQDDWVQEYCKQRFRPSVYLVTGVKIGLQAVIEQGHVRGRSGDLTAQVDTTATGVPLKTGPSIGGEVINQRETSSSIEGPFVLGYQLKRLRLKKDGSVKRTEGYTKHALFDDTKVTEDTLEVVPLEDLWDVEDVSESTDHDTAS